MPYSSFISVPLNTTNRAQHYKTPEGRAFVVFPRSRTGIFSEGIQEMIESNNGPKAPQLVQQQLKALQALETKLKDPDFTQTLRIQNVQAFPSTAIAESSVPGQQLLEVETQQETQEPAALIQEEQAPIATEMPAQIEEPPVPAHEEQILTPNAQPLAHPAPPLLQSPVEQTPPTYINTRVSTPVHVPSVATPVAPEQTQLEDKKEGVPGWVKIAGGVAAVAATGLLIWLLWPKPIPTDLNGGPRRAAPRRQGKDSIRWTNVKPKSEGSGAITKNGSNTGTSGTPLPLTRNDPGSGATTTTQPPTGTGEGTGATTTTQPPANADEGTGASTTTPLPSKGSEEDGSTGTPILSDDSSVSSDSQSLPPDDSSSSSASVPQHLSHRAVIKNWAKENGISPENYTITHTGQGKWTICYLKDGQWKIRAFFFPKHNNNKHTIVPSPQANATQRTRERAPTTPMAPPISPIAKMQSSTNGFLQSFFNW